MSLVVEQNTVLRTLLSFSVCTRCTELHDGIALNQVFRRPSMGSSLVQPCGLVAVSAVCLSHDCLRLSLEGMAERFPVSCVTRVAYPFRP